MTSQTHHPSHDPPAALPRRPLLFLTYLATLALLLAAVAFAFSKLPFVTLSCVPAGQGVHESWTLGLTLDTPNNKFHPLDPQSQSFLEHSISFKPIGSLELTSTDFTVTPSKVSWQESRTTYTATGARLVANLTWQARPDAADGQPGEIDLVLPSIPPPHGLTLRSGNYEKTDDGRYVLRQVRVYSNPNRLATARFVAALIPAFPVALLLHALLIWPWRLRSAKRNWIATVTPPDPAALPRTFYSSPTTSWIAWTILAAIAGVIGCIFTTYAIIHRELTPMLDHVMIVVEAIALALALLFAWLTARPTAAIHVDRRSISISRGLSRPRWITARWHDLRSASTTSRTYRGTTVEWIQITLPDGTRRKIPSDVIDYETLKDHVIKLYFQR